MTMAEALRKVYEDGHEDVSSSKRMCQTIIEDATQIRTKLDSMSAEDKLDTWWTNKLAKSADNLNSARDYICLLYTSPSPRDPKISRMPSSA